MDELFKLTENLAVSEAAQRRLFYERQAEQVKGLLAKAEEDLKKTQEATGVIELDNQAKAMIEAAAVLRAQIASKEVQLSSMSSFATEQNPEMLKTRQELASLRHQLSRLVTNSNIGVEGLSRTKVTDAGLDYVRKFREVKYREATYELLLKQLELARIDEAKDSSVIQSLDRAVLPERRSKPRRTLIAILGAVLGIIVGCALAVVAEVVHRTRRNPEDAKRLQLLSNYLREPTSLFRSSQRS